MKRKLVVLVLAVFVVGLTTSGSALAGFDRSRIRVDSISTDRAERLIAWSLKTPADPNATTSPGTCAKDRLDVWFLPVFIAPGQSAVSCSVPRGSRLVLNLGGTLCNEDAETPRAKLVSVCTAANAEVLSLQTATVDKDEIDEFASEATGVFDVNLPNGNVLDLPAGRTAFAYVGRNVLISGLDRGVHDVRLVFRVEQASEGQFDVDITYHVTVG